MLSSDSKPWWQSKAVWGGILAAVAGIIATVSDKPLPPDEVETLANSIPEVLAIIGGIIAVVGRIRAQRKIGKAE